MYRGPWSVRQIAHFFNVKTPVIHAAINRKGAYKQPSAEEKD
jgi:hypothetical protein